MWNKKEKRSSSVFKAISTYLFRIYRCLFTGVIFIISLTLLYIYIQTRKEFGKFAKINRDIVENSIFYIFIKSFNTYTLHRLYIGKQYTYYVYIHPTYDEKDIKFDWEIYKGIFGDMENI